MKYIAASTILLFSFFLAFASTDHWESIITTGSQCHYLVPTAPVDDLWTSIEFDDSGWATGPGGIGYGDDDDSTLIDTAISVYCRYTFNISDLSVLTGILLDVDFDDGFVATLNGTELARFNLGPAESTVAWDQVADGYYEAQVYQGYVPMRFDLGQAGMDLLVQGKNVLTIEVHNQSLQSSDLSSNIYLHAGISTGDTLFNTTPPWFIPPFIFEKSNIPLMVINTDGQTILNEPRITAHMGLIYNGEGMDNSLQDTYNMYDGQISIEIRGESTQGFPKKSYSIETQTDSGTNNNVSLLGLPEENDFVLYGPYSDKSQIRNVITYRLFGLMGRYSPRTRFLELVIDDDYKGLYVLTEKIKRDKNRVDIARLTPADNTLPEMSGGYILRIDKKTGMEEYELWESDFQPPVSGYDKVEYQYFDPGYDELTSLQRTYIRDWIHDFEEAMVSPDFKDPVKGYRLYLDVPSFIDLMILNELTKDVDGYRLSHYFYKLRDDRGGKLVQGPPWDYNLTFGNMDYGGDINQAYNWLYTKTMTVYWWARLMQDPWFRNELYCRWEAIYSSILDPGYVSELMDHILADLGDAIERNYYRWPVLGLYVWPNYFVGNTYQEEETFLRTWIDNRLAWMEGQWGGLCGMISHGDEPVFDKPGQMKVYPNPSDLSGTFVSLPYSQASMIRLRLTDIQGRVLLDSELQIIPDSHSFRLPDLGYLPDGIYLLETWDGSSRFVNRLIKN